MKNVFENSSGSESEPEVFVPPPKKLKVLSLPEPLSANDGDSEAEFEQPEPLDFEEWTVGTLEPPARSSLDTSILYSNSVGLKMMEKMGYKVGQALGSGRNPDALVEPLTIRMKASRAGLGGNRGASVQPFTQKAITELRDQLKDKYMMSLHIATIAKLQKFCFHESGDDERLEAGEITEADIDPLWKSVARGRKPQKRTLLFNERGAPNISREPPATECEQPSDPVQLLIGLLQYSRENYFYCPYCSVRYDDAADLESNCPGITAQDHDL